MPIHDHEPNQRGSLFLWAGTVLGVLLVVIMWTHGFGLLRSSAKGDDGPPALVRQGEQIMVPEGSPLRTRIVVAVAAEQPVSGQLVLPGAVEADPSRTAAVLSPLTGRVVELKVALGDRVAKGQVLALIDSPDLGQAYEDNDKAADSFALTQKNLERQEEQFKIGVASDKDLDQSRSDHAQAQAEYTRTQARLNLLGAPLQADHHSRLLPIRAPVNGSVTTLAIGPGMLVNDPTLTMMTVADLSTVWVTALVPEKDVALVAKNQQATVILAAYPDKPLDGKVLFVSDVIEPDSRRNKIRIAFANADYALKPNMYATVTLAGAQRNQVVLPSSALLMNNDRTSVFIATAPWTFERRTVDAQLEESSTVSIGSGVKPGEQVVVQGGILLND